MAQMSTFNLGKKTVQLQVLRGEVTGEPKIWTTTHVSGGSGSGFVTKGTGSVHTSPVTSRTEEHLQFFVRVDGGKELPIRLTDQRLAVDKGHRVSLVTASKPSQADSSLLAMYNHNTDIASLIKAGWHQWRMHPFVGILCLAAIALASIIGVLGLTAVFSGRAFLNGLIAAVIGFTVAWHLLKYMMQRGREHKMLVQHVQTTLAAIRAETHHIAATAV